MNARTLKALRGSIRKWELILEGRGEDHGVSNCPLCKEFYNSGRCSECPVRIKTKEIACRGTPYVHFSSAMLYDCLEFAGDVYCDIPSTAFGPRSQKVAEQEIKFLRSLLP